MAVARLQADNERLRLLVHKLTAQLSANTEAMKHKGGEIYGDVNKMLSHHGVTKKIRRTMIKMQLRPDASWQAPYSKEEMEMAVKLHYYSTSGYDRMKQAGLMLPHSRKVLKSKLLRRRSILDLLHQYWKA